MDFCAAGAIDVTSESDRLLLETLLGASDSSLCTATCVPSAPVGLIAPNHNLRPCNTAAWQTSSHDAFRPTTPTFQYPPPSATAWASHVPEERGFVSNCNSTRSSPDGSESDVDNILERYSVDSLNAQPTQEELEKEPWYITLKSAGVRVKGRSRRELLDVVDKIKKRRRESAARSRAKKASKIHTLTAENEKLRRENEELKRALSGLRAERSSLASEHSSES